MLKRLAQKLYFAKNRGGKDYGVFHAIHSPTSNIVFFPIPKNMCSTLKQALYELETGQAYDKKTFGKDIHDFYFGNPKNFNWTLPLKFSSAKKVVIIRDPIGRFVSAYRNRVLDLNDLQPYQQQLQKQGLPVKPDINFFIENLDSYRRISKSIKHHTDPQTFFTGVDMNLFDIVCDIKAPQAILDLIRSANSTIEFKREKSGGTKVSVTSISSENLKLLETFYRQDIDILAPYLFK